MFDRYMLHASAIHSDSSSLARFHVMNNPRTRTSEELKQYLTVVRVAVAEKNRELQVLAEAAALIERELQERKTQKIIQQQREQAAAAQRREDQQRILAQLKEKTSKKLVA